MNKTRNNELIRLADRALNLHADNILNKITEIEGQIQSASSEKEKKTLEKEKKLLESERLLRKREDTSDILDSYNGQVASLSVSVAMSGLLPTLAFFYQDKPETNSNKAYRRNILDVIAIMMNEDHYDWNVTDPNAKSLLEYAINHSDEEKALRQEITECAIALKQVVRTYNLV